MQNAAGYDGREEKIDAVHGAARQVDNRIRFQCLKLGIIC